MGNPPAGGTFAYNPQEGYIPQAFTHNNIPSYNGPMHLTVTPFSNYPFYTQPMYALPNMHAYPNPAGLSASSVTPFFRWIEDYPLLDGLKMPSHIGSYDGKGDLDNFLHLFEGAIRMKKWLMLVAGHMFTYTLKDSARIWWNSQKTGSTNVHQTIEETVSKGQRNSLSPREILAIEKVAKTFEQPPRLPGANSSKDNTRYCHFHEDYRHETNQCRELKHQIEEVVKSGRLAHLVKEKKEKTTGTSSEERKKKKRSQYSTKFLFL
ncbi:hypothetical protein Tco_1299964 [Tanacetum coccineum]